MLVAIDPTNMSEYEAGIAGQFLKEQMRKGNSLIRNDEIYRDVFYLDPRTGVRSVCDLKFDYSFVLYINPKHPERDYFAVIGSTRLGVGDTAIVNKVKGKLTFDEDEKLIFVSNKSAPSKGSKAKRSKYAIKVESHATAYSKERALRASLLSQRNKKLGICFPNFFSETASSMVMKRLKDYELEQILPLRDSNPELFDQIIEKTKRWELFEILKLEDLGLFDVTLFDRLIFSRAILQAYNEQVRDLKIEHRDIKAENIIIDYSNYLPEVTFFDYGLARDAREKDACAVVGTVGYISPEVLDFKGSCTGKSDLYSLACVLAQLWGDTSAYNKQPKGDKCGYLQASNRTFDFFEETPEAVQVILEAMAVRNPDNRPSSDEAIAVFDAEIERYGAEILRSALFQ